MRVVLELFLLDNLLMNALILRVAEALSGSVKRRFGIIMASALGSVYAVAALSLGGLWLILPTKALVSLAMVFTAFRVKSWRSFGKVTLCFYAATFIIGGMCFALVSMLGGYTDGFILEINAPMRALLAGAALAAFLPRWIRQFLAHRRSTCNKALLRINALSKELELNALLDTGNQLVEPFSGRPVMLISPRKGLEIGAETPGAYPVPYASISNEGLLFAIKPQKIELYRGGQWISAPMAFVAVSPIALKGGMDAIVSDSWWQSSQ